MKAGNAYCQHFHDGGRCPYRAASQDRFGAWACSMHIALVEKSLQVKPKQKYIRRWKVLNPRPPQTPRPPTAPRKPQHVHQDGPSPTYTSTLPPIQLDPHWTDPCPFEPGQFYQGARR